MSLIPEPIEIITIDTLNEIVSKNGIECQHNFSFFITSKHDHMDRISIWLSRDELVFDYLWSNIVSYLNFTYIQVGNLSLKTYFKNQFIRRVGEILLKTESIKSSKVKDLIYNQLDDAIGEINDRMLRFTQLSLEELEKRNLKVVDNDCEVFIEISQPDYDSLPNVQSDDIVESLKVKKHFYILLEKLGIIDYLKENIKNSEGHPLNPYELSRLIAFISDNPKSDSFREIIRDHASNPQKYLSKKALNEVKLKLKELEINIDF